MANVDNIQTERANERVKLIASMLNNLGAALFGAAAVRFYAGASGEGITTPVAVDVIIWLAASLVIILLSIATLQMIDPEV